MSSQVGARTAQCSGSGTASALSLKKIAPTYPQPYEGTTSMKRRPLAPSVPVNFRFRSRKEEELPAYQDCRHVLSYYTSHTMLGSQ